MKALLVAVLAMFSVSVMALTPYAQLSSDIDQIAGGFDVVQMEIVDGVESMGITQGTGETTITVEKKGLYMVIASPQTTAAVGCLNLWFILNGLNLDNSNVRICQTHADQTDVIISQGALCLAKGDVLKLGMSGIGIQSTKPANEPLIPSIIFTMFQIGSACK